jgi:hypothetical protein
MEINPIIEREELMRIFRDAQVGFMSEMERDRCISAIIRWKRGKDYWCAHVDWQACYDQVGFVWRSMLMPDAAQFCPECGAKRPE